MRQEKLKPDNEVILYLMFSVGHKRLWHVLFSFLFIGYVHVTECVGGTIALLKNLFYIPISYSLYVLTNTSV